ncbi:MAG TPA: transglutaminase-like domain-containing protein [Thermoanaerobaculia bacterium]|nr:transglutaminase-like domain-containing protein [Thermoanaerobaculia bacterium]
MLKLIAALLLASATVTAAAQTPPKLTFSEPVAPVMFLRSGAEDPYLAKLRADYKLDAVVASSKSDLEKVKAMSRWVRSRWEHNGSNTPTNPDPASILQEAASGKQFRCVEYAQVLAAALTSVGVSARVLALATEDVETRPSGAGHVVAEAWLADAKKWIMVDGQWDVIPFAGDTPLNAVELQNALATKRDGITVSSLSGTKSDEYFAWVAPYLYYFRTNFDSRYPTPPSRAELCLFPVGAKPIAIFQGKWPLSSMAFTHSVEMFYAPPQRL